MAPDTRKAPGQGPSAEQMNGEFGARVAEPYDIARGLRRRREAALRLPPLRCGCRDPLDARHLDDRCRWRRAGRWAA